MKKTLAILGIALFASCSPDAPEGKPSSRVGNTDDGKTGIIIAKNSRFYLVIQCIKISYIIR